MFVSFGVSLGGAVGPIEDGTDVFAGQFHVRTLHMHDGPDGRHDLYMWSTRPAKTCVTANTKRLINRVDDAPAWRAARRLDGPAAGVFAG